MRAARRARRAGASSGLRGSGRNRRRRSRRCFFFRAEDGIRGKLVTGVQTCALPIFTNLFVSERWRPLTRCGGFPIGAKAASKPRSNRVPTGAFRANVRGACPCPHFTMPVEIGRASCRESVYVVVEAADHELLALSAL